MLDLRQNRPCLAEEHLPDRRQRDAVTVAIQQLRFEQRLQFLNMLAERRLGEFQLLRRLPEMQGIGDRDERPDVTQLHLS